MKVLSSTTSITALVLVLGASFAPGDAQAAFKTRTIYTNPAGICQAALPVFEGVIRKRPLAVQNEGITNSYITCSFTSQGNSISRVTVYFASNDGASHDVSCTGVSGSNGGENQYVVKSTTVPANGTQFPLIWKPADFQDVIANFPSSKFSISCNLLPGVGINDSELDFFEDVGA